MALRTLAVTLTVLLSVVSASEAQDDLRRPTAPWPGQGMQAGMDMMDDATFRPTLPALQQLLGLSQNQVRRAVPLRDSMLAQTRALRGEVTALAATMRASRDAVGPDSMAVLRDRMQGLMQKLLPARLRFQEALQPLLTREQLAKLDAHRDAMLHQMGQRMRHPS